MQSDRVMYAPGAEPAPSTQQPRRSPIDEEPGWRGRIQIARNLLRLASELEECGGPRAARLGTTS